jgi:hypothetical protein
MKQYEQFVGLLFSEFEAKVRELYPFGEVHFSGGGSLVIDTGLRVASENGGYYLPIEIHTDLYADDTQDYEEVGEERISFLNDSIRCKH